MAALVQNEFALDPKSSHLFVFFSRSADRVKILHWDRNGFVLTYKCLAEGRFRPPRADGKRYIRVMTLKEALELLSKKEAQITSLTSELQAQRVLLEKQQAQLEKLLRILYGKKSEKNAPKTEEDTEALSQRSKKNSSSEKSKPSRKKLPEHLEREIVKHELPESDRKCKLCGHICHCIGKEVSEQLEFIPARLFVKEHRRYQYGCRFGCSVFIAPPAARPIKKGIPGPGLLAEVLINKYQDSLPLYRQSLRLKRHGIEIPDSTLCDWVHQTATLLSPLVKLMHCALLLKTKIHTDDTPVPVLSKGKTKQGRLWAYVSQGDNCAPFTVYDYSATRSQGAPQKFLVGFKGYLQADAYAGYDKLYQDGQVIEIGCMAHVRRKFFDVASSVKGDSFAQDALKKIEKIYTVESICRGMSPHHRYYFRKHHLKFIYRKFHRWLVKKQKQAIPNTPIKKAFNYALNHWRALQNVFSDGRLEVDNNIAERAMRPIAIGRKNWLFAGSDQSGHHAAIIYSLIESAKQNGLNTFEYLSDVINRISDTEESELYLLLPYNYST